VRRRLVRRGAAALLAWLALIVAVVLTTAWLAAGADGWPSGSRAPLLLDVVLAAGAVGVLLVHRRWRGRHLGERAVARGMDDATDLPAGSVLGGLELSRTLPPGVSPTLASEGERTLLARLGTRRDGLADALGGELDRWARWARGGVVVLAPLLGVLLVTAPERSRAAWVGLARPLDVLVRPALPALTVEPGSLEVPRGAPVQVRVRAAGRDEVTLHWQMAGDIAQTTSLPVSDERAAHAFAEVTAPITYSVSAPDGARSPTYTVVPVDPLFVSDVLVRLVFPAYTGRDREEHRGEIPPLALPVGTRVEVEGHGNRPLGAAGLVPVSDDEAAPNAAGRTPPEGVTFEVRGADFQGAFMPRRAGRLGWWFEDSAGGVAERVPPDLDITLLPDHPPTVAFTLPGKDTVLAATLRQPLVIQAEDDYGLDALELVAWRVTALGDARTPVAQRVPLGGVPGAVVRPLLDLAEWGLLPGDEVHYYARVVDGGPGAQEGRTPEYVLAMPDAAGLRRETQEALDRAAGDLDEMRRRATERAEEMRTQARQAAAPERTNTASPFQPPESGAEEVDFETRENLRRAVEEQQSMAARVDSMREEMDRLSNTLREAGVRDPELRDDLEALEELLDEVGGAEVRERLRELAGRLEEMDRTRARESLEELASQEEAFRERLDQALDRMKRAAAQQDFRATAREAEELAAQEGALAAAMAEDEDPAARAEQQEALEERTEAMDERMERLQERLEELEEDEAARGVDEARARTAEAMQNMNEAAARARAQQGAEAGAQAERAAGALDEAVRELQEAQQRMMEQRAEALQGALDQTAQDALSLARRQRELREAADGASQEEVANLRGDVASLEQGVRAMAENLSVAARAAGAPQAERELGSTLGQAMGALQETVAAMEGAAGSRVTAASDQAVAALNQVALDAMAAAAKLGEGGSGGSLEDMMDALERLAQEQADVNNQASQMMPMELPAQAMQEQMQSMAEGQQSVASDLGELSNQEGDGPLGDLQALAEEAEALARELAQGRLEAGTRERQEQLFHRLLDAGRSLEKEEFSDERESTAPGMFEPGVVADVQDDALGLLRFRMPEAAALGRLPAAARPLVLRYFERLNRREPPSRPPEAR
jgi:hypothetical protein